MAQIINAGSRKQADPYYLTPAWRALRAACIKRDGNRCTVPGCGSTHRLTADHIRSRRQGGADSLTNLRTLCGHHDAQVREMASGERRRGGKPVIKGSDADGWPLDPRR